MLLAIEITGFHAQITGHISAYFFTTTQDVEENILELLAKTSELFNDALVWEIWVSISLILIFLFV